MAQTTQKLAWQASTIHDWIDVKPISGIGNTEVTITTDEAEYGSTDTAGTVTITCAGCDSPITITVTRCTKEIECGCSALTVDISSLEWDADNTDDQTISVTKDTCITNVSYSVSGDFSEVTHTDTSITVKPNGVNTDTANTKTGTVTVSYNAGTGTCSTSVELRQNAKQETCTACTCYAVGDATGTAKWDDESATVEFSYTARTIDSACTVSEETGETSQTVVIAKNDECSGAIRTGTLTWIGHKACDGSSKCSDTDVTINWTVEQEAHADKEGCMCTECTCYAVGDAIGTAKWDDESATVKFSCTATTIDSDCNVTTAVTEESATVTFAKNDECSSATRNGSLTWAGHKTCDGSNKCSDTDVTISWTVEQEAHAGKTISISNDGTILDCNGGTVTFTAA